MDQGQLKISGKDADEVIAAARAVVSANVGKYDPAFDRATEYDRGDSVYTATIHRLVKLGAKTKDGK